MELFFKIVISIKSAITVFLKLMDVLSSNQRRRDLVSEMELLSRLSKLDVDEENRENINKKVNSTLASFLESKRKKINFFNLFYSLCLFVGFGWWTLQIYNTYQTFNPWIILTALISFIGFSLILDNNWSEEKDTKDKVLFSIKLMKDIRIAIIVLGSSITIGILLYLKIKEYSNWMILIVVLLLMGLKVLFDSVKIER